jgi:hypothetical protein
MHMQFSIKQLAAAGAVVGFLGFGGVSLASAQEDTTTTVPAAEETPAVEDAPAAEETPAGGEQAPALGEEGCDHGEGDDATDDAAETAL